jgi:hypothetical protein
LRDKNNSIAPDLLNGRFGIRECPHRAFTKRLLKREYRNLKYSTNIQKIFKKPSLTGLLQLLETKKNYSFILIIPATRDLMPFLDNNAIRNCNLTREDVSAAEDIFGPDTSILQGKTTQHKASNQPTHLSPIPPDILSKYRDVTVFVDILFVNRIPFLITSSAYSNLGQLNAFPAAHMTTSTRHFSTCLAYITNVASKFARSEETPNLTCCVTHWLHRMG